MTKYGTKAIKLPAASDAIYQAVAKLPDDFPFDAWDNMNTTQQLRTVQSSNLSLEEQWEILNAGLPIGILRQVQNLSINNDIWRSKAEKNYFLERIWEAGTAIYAIKNHDHPLSYDRAAEKIIIDLIYSENDVKDVTAMAMPDLESLVSSIEYFPQRSPTARETKLGSAAGTLLDHSKKEILNAQNRLMHTDEKRIINIFYTSKTKSNFSRQANYQRRMLEEKGYDVVMHKVNSLDEFKDAWNNMDESRAALIFAHSNGNALLFEDGTSENAISWSGKNSKNKPIGNIRDLEGPEIDEVYLMSCNTANEMLQKYQGVNVASAFRDLPNVKKVYGYDGSMSYEDDIKDYFLGRSDPRLSDDDAQIRFKELLSSYSEELANDPDKDSLSYYDGWFLYDDEEE